MIMSYTGGDDSLGISMISGFTFTNFDFENFGSNSSKSPTFVVWKVPLEVLHLHGANLSFCGMYSLVLGCRNNKSPSAPLSSKIRQTLLADFVRPFLATFGTPSMVVHKPLPLTTLACNERILFTTILSALVFACWLSEYFTV